MSTITSALMRRARALFIPVAALAALLAASACLPSTLPVPSPNDLSPSGPAANVAAREMVVLQQIQLITQGEQLYDMNKGKFGTLDELIADGHINQRPDNLGYKITLTVTNAGGGYTLVASPQVYGPNGQRSFYVDQSNVIRGANHEGGPATASDPPVRDLMGN
jgi:hypothetical protein